MNQGILEKSDLNSISNLLKTLISEIRGVDFV